MNICQKNLNDIIIYVEGGSFKNDLKDALEKNKKNSDNEVGMLIGENFIINKFRNKLWIYKGVKCYLLDESIKKKESKLKKRNATLEQLEVIKECFSSSFKKIEEMNIEDFLSY